MHVRAQCAVGTVAPVSMACSSLLACGNSSAGKLSRNNVSSLPAAARMIMGRMAYVLPWPMLSLSMAPLAESSRCMAVRFCSMCCVKCTWLLRNSIRCKTCMRCACTFKHVNRAVSCPAFVVMHGHEQSEQTGSAVHTTIAMYTAATMSCGHTLLVGMSCAMCVHSYIMRNAEALRMAHP